MVAPFQGDNTENAIAPSNTDGSAYVAWGNYVRFLRHEVYCMSINGVTKYLYIAENKSVAYRDASAIGNEIGRAVSTIWGSMKGWGSMKKSSIQSLKMVHWKLQT